MAEMTAVSDSVKLLYLLQGDEVVLKSEYPGIIRKVRDQLACFESKGIACDVVYLGAAKSNAFNLLRRFPFQGDGLAWREVPNLKEYDCVYIRRPDYISKDMVGFLSRLKSVGDGNIVILEIPTFPYDSEMMSPSWFPLLIKDRRWRRHLSTLVDKITVFSKQKHVFGVPAISTINGIDFNNYQMRKPIERMAGTVDIMCVASFSRFHGIDRFLAGMKVYYDQGGDADLVLHLVGNGMEISALKRMTEEFALGDRVVYYGPRQKPFIDDLSNKCSLAIECLGIHRKGTNVPSSSLKSREYLARGLPFIYSWPIDCIDDTAEWFAFRVPSDDSPIDIQSVLDFENQLYSEKRPDDVAFLIRDFGKRIVDINVTMDPVVKFIEGRMRCGNGFD